MTQGRAPTALFESLAYPIAPKPPGLELYAPDIADPAQFPRLTHTLSSLFCASINFLNVKESLTYAAGTVTERMTLRNKTLTHSYYGTTTRETVCTENLTPFKKLLPNRAKSGIATLLNPLKLFDSEYFSMQVAYESGELTQRIDVLFDLLSGVHKRTLSDWDLQSVFGAALGEPNPLVHESRIFVHLPEELLTHVRSISADDDAELYSIQPKANELKETSQGTTYVYDLLDTKRRLTNVEFAWNNKALPVPLRTQRQSITAHRYQSGYGLLDGGLTLTIENHEDNDILVRYFEAIPWVFRVYFHTIEVRLNDTTPLQPFTSDFEFFSISPAKERESPNEIEFGLRLPARSSVVMRVHFDKVFLKYTEHPPDANRGFDLDSSVVMYCRLSDNAPPCSLQELDFFNTSTSAAVQRLYTESLLISLPTPDFSMPYNVIMLTSTIITMFFGSLFNVLIRREDESKEESSGDAVVEDADDAADR